MHALQKILNVAQTQATDAYTIQNNGVTSLELMESAAMAFVNALDKQHFAGKKIIVVCGVGNNGGDGFAVCRLLKDLGIDAQAVLLQFKETLSDDCGANKARLDKVSIVDASSTLPTFADYDIIIDAIFGSGLNSPVRGFVAEVIQSINEANKEVYSIDVPSGLYCDRITDTTPVIAASHVICFQRPKLSFFFPENSAYINTWEVVNIGLDEAFIQQQPSDCFLLNKNVLNLIKPRHKQSHKGTYGHALLMAGAYGKMGAAVLSAKACLRSGVGLLTVMVPKCGYAIMQISAPEAMCITDKSETKLTNIPDLKPYKSIGIGPGIGQDIETEKMLEKLLNQSRQALVLDADAINILSKHNELIDQLPKNTILTPHIKEFDRLVGASQDTTERFEKLKAFSTKHHCIVVLKNANTCISSPEGKLYFNTSGNQGMATGGSGDVLTGIITGLVAQRYEPLLAAIIGVYLHGKAGDRALESKGYSSLIASDIIEYFRVE